MKEHALRAYKHYKEIATNPAKHPMPSKLRENAVHAMKDMREMIIRKYKFDPDQPVEPVKETKSKVKK